MLTAVASGFVLAIFTPLVRRISSPAGGWILSSLPAILAAYFLAQASGIWTGGVILANHPWAPALGISLNFRLDGLSLLFALLITGIGATVLVYSGRYLRDRSRLGRLYALLLFFMASMLGLVLAENLLLLYVFWELTSVSSYLLIGFEHERPRARSAALQSLLVTALGGLCLLAGVVLLGRMGGSFEISALLAQGDAIRAHALYPAALSLILIGAFTKSAQFPFHFWLPNAMEAPTPVSAYLHAATMVKAGVYLLARLSPVLGGTGDWTAAVMVVGAVTMVGGAVLALNKTDLKQILAYSTVSVLGILVFLTGLGTPVAIEAMMVYLVAHGLYKGALFLTAGAVEHEAGTRDITKLGALQKSMPVTACAAALAALSMAGLPPLLGFIGKELLYDSVLQAPRYEGLLTLAAVTAGALLFVLAAAAGFRPFFSRASHVRRDVHEAAFSLWVGPLLLGVGSLALGLTPSLMNAPVRSAVLAIAPAVTAPVELALFHGLTPALFLSIVSAGGGLALYALHGRLVVAGQRLGPLAEWGPASMYDRAVDALNRFAVTQTGLLQSGYLRHYLQVVIATTVVLVGTAIVTLDRAAGTGRADRPAFPRGGARGDDHCGHDYRRPHLFAAHLGGGAGRRRSRRIADLRAVRSAGPGDDATDRRDPDRHPAGPGDVSPAGFWRVRAEAPQAAYFRDRGGWRRHHDAPGADGGLGSVRSADSRLLHREQLREGPRPQRRQRNPHGLPLARYIG